MKTAKKPGMKKSRTPWAAKLRPDMAHEVVPDRKGRGMMLLPTPTLVAEEISRIPHGALLSVSELRDRLAARYDADIVCPLMTGIFYNIIAGAAEDQLSSGGAPLAPYWRVVPDNGTLSMKTPFGPERQAEHLRSEGHTVELRREKLAVPNFKERARNADQPTLRAVPRAVPAGG